MQHALGVSIVGSSLHPARIARASVGSGNGCCTVFGSGDIHETQDAAFANAVSGHASLLEDSGPGGPREGSHPGTYVFPAALAVAEQQASSGRDLLRAVCAAYQTVSRLGSVTPAEVFKRGLRVVPVLGPFGAAAAAGVLCNLTREQMAASFGIAANLASGFNQGFIDGTMEPYFHPAFAARNGILAARLAAAGCTAAPWALEGDRGFFATFAGMQVKTSIQPDAEFAVCRVGTKRFATCLYNQGMLALIRNRFPDGIAADRIVKVTVSRPSSGQNGLSAPGVSSPLPYTTMLAMQMSAQFTAAAALAGRAVESATYYERASTDEAVHRLAARIDLAQSASAGVRVVIELVDQPRVELMSNDESALEFSSSATLSQFTSRVRPIVGNETDQVIDMLVNLHRLENVRSLTDTLRRCWSASSDKGEKHYA